MTGTGATSTSAAISAAGSFVHIPPPTSDLGRYLTPTITIEMWVHTTGLFGSLLRSGSGGYSFDLSNGYPVAHISGSTALVASTPINDRRWHHLTLVAGADGGGQIKLYVDGHLDATESRPNDPIFYDTSSCGSSPNITVAQGVAGGIDEVAIYDHALTGGDILNRWLAHTPYLFRVFDKLGLLGSIAQVGDPVNTAIGSLTDAQVDLSSPSGTFGLDWTRVYNSADTTVSSLGRGWMPGFTQTAKLLSSGEVEVTMPDGRRARFTPDGGGFDRPAELPASLTDLGGGAYRVDFTDGTRWTFDTAGRLASMADASGQTVTITRNTNGDPTTAVSSTGASLTFTYTTNSYNRPRLTQVATGDGRTVTYAYSPVTFDGQADLVSVTDPNTKRRTTRWTRQG